MAIGRILSGDIKQGDQINVLRKDGSQLKAKIIKLKEFSGLQTNDVNSATAGDIAGLAGFEEVDIGDTLAKSENAEPLPFIEIDPATVQMEFSVNDGHLQGKMEKKLLHEKSVHDLIAKQNQISPLAFMTQRKALNTSLTLEAACRLQFC
jgi:GTP-binding protein